MTSASGDPGDDLDVDAAWAEIVAHWDLEVSDTLHGERRADPGEACAEGGDVDLRGGVHPVARPAVPENRHQDRHPDSDASDTVSDRSVGQPQSPAPDLLRDTDAPGRHIAEPTVPETPSPGPRVTPEPADPPELDEHFIPQLDDRSLYPTSWVARVGWGCLLGSPAFFLFSAVFWRNAPGFVLVLAAVALLLGFALLVISLPDRSKNEDRPDNDGAVT